MARVVLRVAIADGEPGTRVGGISAQVMLYVARAADCSGFLDEVGAVNSEPFATGGDGGSRDAAKSPSESLDIARGRCRTRGGSGGDSSGGDSSGGGNNCGSSGCGSSGCGSDRDRPVSGTGNWVALVVNGNNLSKVSHDAELSVEAISLAAGLGCTGVGSSLSLGANALGSVVGSARVYEGVAHELSYDSDGLGRPVVERRLVDGLEARLFAIIEASGELDLGDGTFSEVANVGGTSTANGKSQ